MKKYYVEESGQYKIQRVILASDEDDALNRLHDYLPNFINLEAMDCEVTELKDYLK